LRKAFLVVGLLAAILAVLILVLILATRESRTPPPSITGLTAIDASYAQHGQIDLIWNSSDAEDFAYYSIYASETEITDVSGLSPIDQINDRADVTYQITSYWASGLALALVDGTEYWFAVTAVDSAGNESKVGTSISATPTNIDVASPDPAPTIFTIGIDAGFRPVNATIPVGTTIVWRNLETEAHTVTSDNESPQGLFESGSIVTGGTSSYTFTEVGVFYYHCRFHIGETGTIRVVE